MFKVGDLVVRKPGWQDSAWKGVCVSKGIKPHSPLTVSKISSYDNVTLKEFGDKWFIMSRFNPYKEDKEIDLEDNL